MSAQNSPLGFNRTGISTSPSSSRAMVEGTSEFMPLELTSTTESIGLFRQKYVKDAEPIGSVPPPLRAEGIVTAVVQGLKGTHPTQFIDKLGERLAFERMGVRLYEALISKFDGGFRGGPALSHLEEMMLQEHAHFRLLADVVSAMGGDPTVVTPSADLHATLSKGITEVLVEPRATFAQSLEGILVAELADNECWETLIELARQNGKQDVISSFQRALAEEKEHLALVRTWIAASQNRDPGDTTSVADV